MSIPAAQVTQSGDEISCSVEETNRIREQLGLKPLKVESAGEAAAKKKQKEDELLAARKNAEAADLRNKIEKAKHKRKLNEKLQGPSIAEEAAQEDDDDILAWVNKSRKLEHERKIRSEQEALEKARRAQEEEAAAEKAGKPNTKGLLLRHNADQFQEGEEMILTLADRNIVGDDGNVMEDADELENVNLAENAKWDRNNKVRRDAKKPMYNPYDDDKKGVLSKYDSEDEEEKMELDEDGVDLRRKERAEAVREKLRKAAEVKAAGKVAYSLDGSAKKEIQEYYTAEEMVGFKKKKRKVVKKTRKKKVVDELAHLEPEEDGADHGSRRDREMKDAGAERRKGYDKAVEKAHEKNAKLHELKETALAKEDSEEEDDDAELAAALARNRRLAQQKRTPKNIMAMIEATNKKEMERGQQEEGKGLLFTETTEFVRGVDAEHAQEKLPSRDALGKPVSSTGQNHDDNNAERPDYMNVDDGRNGNASEDDSDDDLGGMAEKAMANKGLAAVLDMVKQKGLTTDVERSWVGRTKDERLDMDSINDRGVRLEYVDSQGRPLTQKEAYRQLSWKFHNKAPSKNKQEKRMKKEALEAQRKAQNDPLTQMDAIHRSQEIAGAPYLIMSGGAAKEQQDQIVGRIEKNMAKKSGAPKK